MEVERKIMIELSKNLERLLREMKTAHPETFYHSLRVKNLTAEMLQKSQEKGLSHYSESQLDSICKGALLHDLGKLKVNNALLTKTSALEAGEMDHLREHARLGAEMVEGELGPAEREIVQNICRFHHERTDGGGYEGERELPLYVWVVALCDAFDALRSDRIYRQSFPVEKIFQMLRQGECGQFDPALIDLLESMVGGRDKQCVF